MLFLRRRKIKNRGYATFCRNERENKKNQSREKISNEEMIVKKYEVNLGTYKKICSYFCILFNMK